ncbi:hypothetical protein [Streptomyces tauricus]|uniref:hypothetical protein n=1 Tax=Streptomyces tauricus TaxID=68274 RepID=UPI00342B8894
MSGPRWRTRFSLLLCVLVPVLAACGTVDGRAADASAAAASFERVLGERDSAALCAALAPGTRGEVEDAEKKPCVEVIGAQDLPAGGTVREVNVYGRQARAVLASDTLFLSQFPDGWKVVAAGCRPRTGQPYQCSVKGG